MLVSSLFSPIAATRDAHPSGQADSRAPSPPFGAVYEANFDFVWRSVRRLGVHPGSIDDQVQEIFLVVHRRLPEFEGRSTIKTWLFGIVLRVVRDHRRQVRRRAGDTSTDPETLSDNGRGGPDESAAKAEAISALYRILDELDDEKREVFVLAELEQMTVPEIAEALDVNMNTAYSRLRAARAAFDEGVARHQARDNWRLR
jgi:RNA polymerase sigma-70 factor (ECF subfamily)